ncbi:MAG: M15 family metallopeptidase [Spirochaetia bacterium]
MRINCKPAVSQIAALCCLLSFFVGQHLFAEEVHVLESDTYFLAPVDKQHQLPENYVPELVECTILGSTAVVTPETETALRSLMVHASQNGIILEIISSYRSYSRQESVFAYWVQYEVDRGASRSQARSLASQYSALPGHSEHQLGTAVDLNIVGTPRFQSIEDTMYQYLASNAHLFGFIISYPPDREQETGYTFEPWHIRYVGRNIAQQMFENNYLITGLTPNRFLARLWY